MSSRRILIYDDDPDILLVTKTILERKGHQIMCRQDCTNIDADLTAFAPQIILMDNWMPDRTGLEAIQYIKAKDAFKHIPVIFFSANSNVEALAKEAGADKLLKKPFDLETLEKLIAELSE